MSVKGSSKLTITGDTYVFGRVVGDSAAIRIYDDSGVLISLAGKNKMDKYGYFVDTNGLCEHEAVDIYCGYCKSESLQSQTGGNHETTEL